MNNDQSYKNHARFDPPLHFFIVPVLLLNVFVAMGVTVHQWPRNSAMHLWLVLVSVALLLLGPVSRMASLRAQDRLIRLEETLRYQRLLGPDGLALAARLNVRQIVAMRFASDAEVAELLQRAVTENLPPKAIKEAVRHWRSDTLRV